MLRTLAVALLLHTPLAAQAIDAARIKEHVRILSSDDFGGRGPAQPGEEKTVAYLAKAFAELGLAPAGPNGSWFQTVELTQFNRVGPVAIEATVNGLTLPWRAGLDVTASSRIVGQTTLKNAPLVFVGYGIDAPEIGWDNYKGADLRGKVAVFLANDPDFEAPAAGAFGGRTLAYAGRFGAKVATAQKHGAAAVLIIHETAAASYPWSQVQNGDTAPGFDITPKGTPSAPFGLRGWLRREVAADLFRRAGLDFEALKVRARDRSFTPVAIGDATLSASFATTAEPSASRNVVARLIGKTRPNETVIYGAHWDAYGTGEPDAKGDRIRNGAIDNATGTAELLEVARAFAAGSKPDRSVLFIAYTAEEKGLLGAEYYAANPLFPLDTTVAAFNLDPHVVLGRTKSLDLIGGGRTNLEADLSRVGAKRGLRVETEPFPEAGWYFRSDHFAFAKKGVPVVYFRAGRDLVDGGPAAGMAKTAAYNERCYHQTCDEFDPGWDMTGAAQEAEAAYDLGSELARSARWPAWNEGVEYKAVRDTSAAVRAGAR